MTINSNIIRFSLSPGGPVIESGAIFRDTTKKHKPEIKLGATVRLQAQSGEIIEGHVVHMWEEKSVLMIRVVSGQLVYNVPASMLIDERKSRT